MKFRADAGFCARYQPRSGGARPHAACGRRARMSPLMADFVAEVAEEGGRLCLGAEHEP